MCSPTGRDGSSVPPKTASSLNLGPQVNGARATRIPSPAEWHERQLKEEVKRRMRCDGDSKMRRVKIGYIVSRVLYYCVSILIRLCMRLVLSTYVRSFQAEG